MLKKYLISVILLTLFSTTYATTIEVKMYLTAKQGEGKSIGDIVFTDSPYGVLVSPNLTGLPPGEHGFHIHALPSCTDAGLDAGGHYDPNNTDKHLGPYNNAGHLGDLPVLMVKQDGTADVSVLAPRLTTNDLYGHSIIIHMGGDNYSDTPAKMGGGGERIACGVFPAKNPG